MKVHTKKKNAGEERFTRRKTSSILKLFHKTIISSLKMWISHRMKNMM